MTRLEYWIRAKTQYSVHSPFVFDLYREVLFAHIPATLLPDTSRNDRRYHALCYKLGDHFRLTTVSSSEQCTELSGDKDFGKVLVVNHPHHDKASEQAWHQLCQTAPYLVAIDLFDVGILFSNPRLHRQYFLLR